MGLIAHFLAKRPPKFGNPPDFFGGTATVFFLPLVVPPPPFFSSTFFRIGSVSSNICSSFCIPPRIQSKGPFSSLPDPLLFAAVAANTLPAAAAGNPSVNEAIISIE
eukprot:TRINITY_DN68674_c0_g1_i1.p1 TRINITY_DN68674_c0_g1~~TRINITY_DN68674_c0_g1_i1.p1  ORF type:complete len:107 (-),score=9.77 TRINITY_DN68674_c0_g1_i1:47-367(-)